MKPHVPITNVTDSFLAKLVHWHHQLPPRLPHHTEVNPVSQGIPSLCSISSCISKKGGELVKFSHTVFISPKN